MIKSGHFDRLGRQKLEVIVLKNRKSGHFDRLAFLIKIKKNRNLLFRFGYCFLSVGSCWPLEALIE
ncbi:hypothetical protein BpHYR1_048716 [Brachionus plicatilis]|uniref:Uncharacterized protein n=1 Tax=Brachionus plicatilis TaxID=10195 RepID=A0A3M7RUH6_BRAPC|nr:hypothetical protein BpHYR1_048716 [Brachionus plicatilis]